MKKGYTAWVLTDKDRAILSEVYPQQYEKKFGHHITQAFGVTEDQLDDKSRTFKVVGKSNSGDGLEALVVEVDGAVNRPDGSFYHVTWSLDPGKYKPKDSNDLIKSDGFIRSNMVISIYPIPKFISF